MFGNFLPPGRMTADLKRRMEEEKLQERYHITPEKTENICNKRLH